MLNINKVKYGVLVLVMFLSAFLRFYKLDQIPASLNWDEVAAGYNAYTIANWGADEYGIKFPITFKSFGDFKHPVHIYLTAIIVKIFGLSDFATRSGSSAIGVLSVIAIYFLARKLFRSEIAGLFSASFLAVSPYAIQFSRGLWENNFALFFFLLGLAFFYYGIEKKNWMLPISFASFGLSFFSYHSAKVVVPPVVLLICLLNFKKLIANKKTLLVSVAVGLFFAVLIIKDPNILGFARVNQTKFSESDVGKNGGIVQTYVANYKKYFSYPYLFEKGDSGPRASVKVSGEFYKIDLVLSAIGLIALLFMKNWQSLAVILLWLVLSPVPGAISAFDPSAIRGIFMIGPILLLAGNGASWILNIAKRKGIQIVLAILIIIFLTREAGNFLNYYFNTYSKTEAIEWQYGMKQIVGYLKKNPDYVQVYMDKVRQQPYIFFLYYLKVPLPELLATVRYDESESKSYNTVISFDNYQFGGWDIIESYPNDKVLYIMTPSFYSGLRYINMFEVKELIKYPNGSNAFFLVTAKDNIN